MKKLLKYYTIQNYCIINNNFFFNILGDKYYVFNGNHLIENSPRSLMDYGFPGFVKKVNGVAVFGEPPLTYLFR
jgi:hypothetical protein